MFSAALFCTLIKRAEVVEEEKWWRRVMSPYHSEDEVSDVEYDQQELDMLEGDYDVIFFENRKVGYTL